MGRPEGSPTRPFPIHTLEQALIVIQAIADKGASRAMDRLLVADAIGRTPNSSEYRKLLSSSLKYGLTTGTEKSDNISPTPLGLKIAAPEDEQDRVQGLVQACMKPELIARIYNHYNRNKLPEPTFLKNALHKTFGVDPSLTEELAGLVVENAKFCGLLQDISGSKYIRIVDTPAPRNDEEDHDDDDTVVPFTPPESVVQRQAQAAAATPSAPRAQNDPLKPKKLFIAHGKNRKPLEALKKILDQFKIPHVVAVDEAHKGRPISAKVAQLMAECSAGIFIFTKDEKFLREVDGGGTSEVYRPSENVVYELGAANVLWDRRIIILREEGVNFPTDFSDIGYITFQGDEVGSKALDLLRELVALGLVTVRAA